MTAPGIWHPFTQHGLNDVVPEVVRAEGARLFTRDGDSVIDAISSWWVQTHGHCNPRITAAIQKQAAELDQIIFAGWTHEPAQRLAASLDGMLPDGLSQIFFSDSGSTAVEVALKMALGHFHNLGEKRDRIIVMEHSYHGDTIGAMSVGARGVFNAAYAPLLFDVATLPFPAAGQECATLDQLKAICADAENPAAALIVEPLVLGAGGMMIYSPETLRAMYEICAEAGVLFIADEVMTGWGRTGTLWACDQAGITPDLMCSAKGLTGGGIPLAMTAARQNIFDSHFSTDRTKTFFHSSSFTANPIACAAACENIAIWRDEPVQDRIDHIAARHKAFGEELRSDNRIVNVRQAGTIFACELRESEGNYLSDLGPRLLRHYRDQGILLRPLGNTVYIMPPYCISDDELDQVYAAIVQSLELV